MTTENADASLVQVSKPGQPPLNIHNCKVTIHETGRVDIFCETQLDFPVGIMANQITTHLERCIIVWKT